MSKNDWSSFWKRTNNSFTRVMQVSTDYFYRELRKRFPLKPGAAVLDYGCGPGLLIQNLLKDGVIVTGADINKSFIHQNRQAFPGCDFILISNIIILPEKQFDQIILLSITQYFESEDYLERIIGTLSNHLKPGGKLIVADVLGHKTSSVRDALGIFIECIRRGRLLAFARFILYLIFSDYRNTSKNNNLLRLSNDFMQQLAKKFQLSVETLKGMTPHPTRTNFIFSRNDAPS